MKQVIFWDAKKVPTRNKSGQEIPGEFHGVFSTKVSAGTPGAYHYQGENREASIAWDYHAIEATVIRGKLRWIDKVLPTFSGAKAQIVLFIESEKALHRVTIKYDAVNLNNVMNNLCGMGANAHETFINMTYWVRKAKDAKGAFKVTDKGDIRWAQTLMFQDNTPQFSFDEWRDVAQEKGLMWQEVKRANGKDEWVADAELKYWDDRMVKMQRYLLEKEVALPFTYGSLIVCEAQNPSGGGNLTPDEIAECKRIYERIKSEYKIPFGRVEVDADSYDPDAVRQEKQYAQSSSQDFPSDEYKAYEDNMQTVPAIEKEELPF